MANKVRFLLENLIDTSTLSTGVGEVRTLLGLENLKQSSRSLVMRSKNISAGSTLIIYGILADPSTIDSFIIGDHNFNANTSYRLDLYSDTIYNSPAAGYTPNNLIISPDFAATDIDSFKYNIPIWFDEVSGIQSFKLTLTAPPSAPMNYFQIGRLFMGNAISTSIGTSFGHNLYWRENTLQYRTEAGTLRSGYITANKVIEFSLNTIYEYERSQLQRALAQTGKKEDFFISLFPESCDDNYIKDYSGIVRMTKIPKYAEFAPSFYSSKYIVEEI